MKIRTIFIGVTLFITSLVIAELALIRFLNIQVNKSPISSVPTVIKKEESTACVPTSKQISCDNWLVKYNHIYSSETISNGVFDMVESESNTREMRIYLFDKAERYFISYSPGISTLKVTDKLGKSIALSQLKKGDVLSVTEKVVRNANGIDDGTVIIRREK